MRQSTVVKLADTANREKCMGDMLPYERMQLLREERARARWLETQK